MPRPRAITLSVAVLGLLVGLGLSLDCLVLREAGVDARVTESSHRTARERGLNQVDFMEVVHFDSPRSVSVAAAGVGAMTLGARESSMLAEQSALRLLATGTDLELTARQWVAFAAATAHIQAIRQTFEASLAVVKQMPDNRYRMEIPTYPAAGDALRSQLTNELIKQLGDETAAEILAVLGSRLEAYFGGFGVSSQTLDFAGNVGTASDLQVTRTVRYWNSIEGGSELRTRRETHFPSLEDAAGELWQPFLDRLSTAGGSERRSG